MILTLGLQWEGWSDVRLVKSYTVPDALLRIAQEGAKVKLQSSTSGTGATPLAGEGTAAQKLYQSGSKYIEYLTMVTSAATQANTGHVVLTAISRNVPLNCMFIADSKQSCDRYRDVFFNVVANSGSTAEFHFVNIRYGSVISNLISQGLPEQSRRYLQSGSSSWISEYESSPGHDSDRLTSQWSDVIKDQNNTPRSTGIRSRSARLTTRSVRTAIGSTWGRRDSPRTAGPGSTRTEGSPGWTEKRSTPISQTPWRSSRQSPFRVV